MSKINDEIKSINSYIGKRIRERRVQLGMTQTDVADAIGITWQQVFKYERGATSIEAGRLYQIAAVLLVSADYFMEGYEEWDRQIDPQPRRRLTYELAEAFSKIKDERHQRLVVAQARTLATF